MTLKHQTNTGTKSSGMKKRSLGVRPGMKKFGKRKKMRKVLKKILKNDWLGAFLNDVMQILRISDPPSLRHTKIATTWFGVMKGV